MYVTYIIVNEISLIMVIITIIVTMSHNDNGRINYSITLMILLIILPMTVMISGAANILLIIIMIE